MNLATLLIWESPPRLLLHGPKIIDEWLIMECTKLSVPVSMLDGPGTQPPSRIVWEIYFEPFTTAVPDTRDQSLCDTLCCERTGMRNVIQLL